MRISVRPSTLFYILGLFSLLALIWNICFKDYPSSILFSGLSLIYFSVALDKRPPAFINPQYKTWVSRILMGLGFILSLGWFISLWLEYRIS